MNTKILSFCIPVYNNSEGISKILDNILSCDNDCFNVIVRDDCSKDNTQEVLSRFHDERLSCARNTSNLGAHMNWLRTLEDGTGEYLYLVMGRDKLYTESIPRLMEFLEYARDNNIFCLRYNFFAKKDSKIYSGISAMINFIGFNHPTGIIFSRKAFLEIPENNRECYFTHSDMYPENYVMRDLLLKGKGAVLRSGVYRGEIVMANMKSQVENGGDISELYYAPARRIKQFFEFVDMIDDTGKFTRYQCNRYYREKFRDLLVSITKAWKSACENEWWQSHYGQNVRNVNRREMFGNVIQAVKKSAEYFRAKGTYSFSRMMIFHE